VTLWRTRIAVLDTEGYTQVPTISNTYCFSAATMVARTCLGVNTYIACLVLFSFLWHCYPTRAMASSFLKFLDHTQLRTTAGRTLLDERSAQRRDLYLTTHNTDKKQISMPPAEFELTVPASKLPQTDALDRAVTGTGLVVPLW